MMGYGDLKVDPYIEYIKAVGIAEDKPYDEMVKELLTASGQTLGGACCWISACRHRYASLQPV